MDEARARLAEALQDRRAELGISLDRLADDARMSRMVLYRLTRGEKVRDTSIAKLDAVLDWPSGTALGILRGRSSVAPEQVLSESGVRSLSTAALSALAAQVVAELARRAA